MGLNLADYTPGKRGSIAGPDSEIMQLLDRIEDGPAKTRLTDKALKAGAQPIVSRARQLAPRGSQEDRDKKSAKQKRGASWNKRLHTTIIMVTRKYGKNKGLAVIGPKWPDGNKAYFDSSPRGREVWYWGKKAGVVRPRKRDWINDAATETRTKTLSAMRREIEKGVQKIMRGKR